MPAIESLGSGEILSPALVRLVYQAVSHYDASEVPFAPEEPLVILPDCRHVPVGITSMASLVPFDEFAATLRRGEKRKTASSESTVRRSLPAAVAARLREEFPWLTDADIAAANARVAEEPDPGDPAPRIAQRLDPAEVEEAAFNAIAEEVNAIREEWAFDEEDVVEHFYVHQPGGRWTAQFGRSGKPCDSAHAKARAHCKEFCQVFQWPLTKGFHYNAHTEYGANMLAREWARKGAFYFAAYAEGGEAALFSDDALPYEESWEFLDWACGIDPDEQEGTFIKIIELRHARPVSPN